MSTSSAGASPARESVGSNKKPDWQPTGNPWFEPPTRIVYTDESKNTIATELTAATSPASSQGTSINWVGTVEFLIHWTTTSDGVGGPPYQAFSGQLSVDKATALQSGSVTNSSPLPTSTTPTPASAASTPLSSSSSSSTTTSAAAAGTPGSHGLSSGGAAGVGVGAAIGGILLASLIFFVCFRRSRKSKPRYDSEIPLKPAPSYGEGKQNGLPQITAIGTWESQVEKHLPQPVPDDSVSNEMSKLKSMINNHVVSYYRTSEIDLDAIDETALASIMEDPQISMSQMRSAIVNPQTRTPALRYLIASAIFSRIGLKSHPSTSFLPPEIASCLESMTGMRDNDQARTTLLSKWRAITASMLQQTYGSNFITESDPRSYNIGHALEELDSVLTRLRARRDENANRRQNLEEILKRAAGFAFILFSHPSFWKFEWLADSNHGPGSVVIFPALLQITDENGERLSRPRPFEDMEIVRLVA